MEPVRVATTVSWLATGLGGGLFLYAWLGARAPRQRQRLEDAGLVMMFASIALRVALKPDRNPIDWTLGIAGVVFVAAALWRLSRTGRPT